MFAGMILGATLVIAALMLIGLGKSAFGSEKHFAGFAVVGLAVAGAVIAILLEVGANEPQREGMFLSSNVTLTEAARAASRLGSPAPTAQASRNIASVPSLIEGLQKRLESEPDDASGWALLAQSYAFVGDVEPAEQALDRAVALGLDEQDLRRRVADATRDPHTGRSIQAAR